MNLGISKKVAPLINEVKTMINEEIKPKEKVFFDEVSKDGRWKFSKKQIQILDELKSKAKKNKLWNFWLTSSNKGYGLTTVEYAYLAEEMGKSRLAAEVFNCNAPDTGNMEVLERFGSEKQKNQWLSPLLEGKIRSAFLMTEPDVASSDATNISMSCELDGENYILNGEKWWSSGAGDPRCQIYIVMCKTDKDAEKYKQHSQILVPANTNGIEILRAMEVFGHDDAPHGHMHLRFENVRVPRENIILGEGRGFEIAQSRLGPGRIHHCMRAIGQAELALEMMCERSLSREAFGEKLANLGANYDIIANCRISIEQARLLCLKTAWIIDQGDAKAAAPWISKIKVVAPNIALKVTDEAIQMFGAAGLSQETFLGTQWTHLRTLRLVDGPDAVHRRQVAKTELKKFSNQK